MAIKAIINNTEKEIEQIKNSDEQDIDYVYSRIGDTKVEGEPPISIKSIGGNLANYRIYGNIVDGESVGDRTENILNELPQNRTNKGITFTNYDNKYIRITGISSDVYAQTDAAMFYLEAGTYSIRFFAKNSEFNTNIFVLLRHLDNTNIITINANGSTFTLNKDETIRFITGVIQNNVEINTDVYYMIIKQSQIPDEYEPYGYKVPVTVEGKNLLPITATSQTINGVTFTVNDDGSVTCNGTASAAIYFSFAINLESGTYIISGTPRGMTNNNAILFINANYSTIGLSNNVVDNYGNGKQFVAVQSGTATLTINIKTGYTCTNLTFYPMIRKADIEDDTYEPYYKPVTTNLYLPEQIKMVGDEAEYIDYAEQKMHRIGADDIDVTLPALSTVKGTNTLSVNTTIQPSNMYIKDNFDYKRVFTATRTIEGESPLNYRSIEDSDSTLKNYRIYGNTETKTRSYSGSAPLSFPIVDGAVSNYRVYGNTVNGESVGELVTDSQSEHYGKYAIPITNNSETENIYLDEPLRKVGDEAEYVDYATQKWHRVRKNLLENTAKSRTINGVTFTVNSDGSVTCNGKCVNNVAVLYIKRPTTFYDETIQYTLTGCPVGGAYNSTYALEYTNSVNQVKPDVGNGVSFTPYRKKFYPNACIRIVIFVGYTCDNLTFYPMIREADIEDDTYEPYIENTEVDVTLPALPAQSSSNSLSVGTSVQPSSVAVDVDEVESCGDKVTDSQSVNYGKYKIPVTLTADSAETTDIYLDEPLRKVGNESDYIDYVEQKQHWVRKNLLKNTMTRQIINGVTFTANEDGSITCNGTAGASAPSVLNIPFTLPIELYEVSGCPDSGGNSTYRVDIRNNDSSVCNYNGNSAIDNGTGCLFDGGNNKNYCIRIAPGYTCDNLTFYPMIRKVDIDDDTYEPYIEDTELDVTLPALPVLPGTNTLTVGTEVQPSSVEIKGHIK